MNVISQPLDCAIEYPDRDSWPLTESDQTREVLIGCVKALGAYLRSPLQSSNGIRV